MRTSLGKAFVPLVAAVVALAPRPGSAQTVLEFRSGVGELGSRDVNAWVQGISFDEPYWWPGPLPLQHPFIVAPQATWPAPIAGCQYVSGYPDGRNTGSHDAYSYQFYFDFDLPDLLTSVHADIEWAVCHGTWIWVNERVCVDPSFPSTVKTASVDITDKVHSGRNRFGIGLLAGGFPMGVQYKVRLTYTAKDPAQISVEAGSGTPGLRTRAGATLLAAGNPAEGKAVQFALGGRAVGSAATDAAGKASLEFVVPDSVGGGDVPLTASFAGDAGVGPASASTTLKVIPAATSVYVVDRSGLISDPVRLKAWLKRATDNAWVVGRTVEFSAGGIALGSGTTGSDGQAYLDWTITEGAASGPLVATYAGEPAYLGSTGTALLAALTTATKVYVPDRAGAILEGVVLKAYFYKNPGNVPIAGRSLRFIVGGVDLGLATTSVGGEAKLYYTIPPAGGAGARTIRAEWAGNGGYLASASTAALNAAKATTYLWTGDRTPYLGETTTVRALYRSLPGYAALAGLGVAFSVDGASIGSAVTDASGWAVVTWTVPADMTGTHQIRVESPGDAVYSAASATASVNPRTVSPTFLWTGDRTLRPGRVLDLLALLRRQPDSAPVAGATITMSIDGTSVGSGVTGADGWSKVSWLTPADMAGNHSIRANFAGDAFHLASSATAKLIPGLFVETYLWTGDRKLRPGVMMTFSALLRRLPEYTPVNFMRIDFYIDGTFIGQKLTLNNNINQGGWAFIDWTAPVGMTGTHAIKAEFKGESEYTGSTATATLAP